MSAIEQEVLPVKVVPMAGARDAWSRLNFLNRFALVLFGLVFIVGLLGPVFAPHSPGAPVGAPFSPAGHGTLLGTDDLGRDILSRVLYGARTTWLGTLVVVGVGSTFGTLVGLSAGATGGWVDFALMRVTDAFLALPGPVLAIAIAAALGASYTHTLLAIVVVWWPLYARLVRGEVTALASRPHLDAARLGSISRRRIWFRHLLPGALPPVLIAISLDLGAVVLVVSGLSFLGLGSPDPAAELGAMTARGLPYLLSDPGNALFPALAVFLIALSSNLAGDAVRDLFAE